MRWSPGDVVLDLVWDDTGPVRVAALRPAGGSLPGPGTDALPMVEIDCLGAGRVRESSGQHRPYAVSDALRYAGHQEARSGGSRTLTVRQQDPVRGLVVTTRLQAWDGTGVVRADTEVVAGAEPVTLTYVSSLALGPLGTGLGDQVRVHSARNAWLAELRWQEQTPEQAGIVGVRPRREGRGSTRGRHAVTALGSWSTGDHLPMGAVEDRAGGTSWVWQVEHQGAWHWELGDVYEDMYVLASGPTDSEHQWRQPLAPGDSFRTVPVAVAAVEGGLQDGLRALTSYRRAIRRPCEDNEHLPVIFNDYMNCLMGDPTAERLTPLIAAAAAVGAEYFVIDAGWYSDEPGWWDSVGAWEPARSRFPDGLELTMKEISNAGMAPGLWLEPEVAGIRSDIVAELPDDAFFSRGGVRLQEHGRFHLDYRCAAVREHMDAVVDRLVGEYGARYFKLDYNIDVAPGTDARDGSPGAGLLGHNRAYLAWLESVLDRHPGLVLENCSSGGMRMDYAMLSRLSLQSTSDQRDHCTYAAIAAAAPSAVTPEQSAVWAYPQPEHSPEEASFCIVNALLGRVHLSGRIDLMSPDQLERVRQAMAAYRDFRPLLKTGLPYWPLGLPGWYDDTLALAVATASECLLAVWFRGSGPAKAELSLPFLAGGGWGAEVVFPADLPTELSWQASAGMLSVEVPGGGLAARLVRLRR